jgi:C_GCAxxG_C_C family probable redox protein
MTVSERREKAIHAFRNGYNCAQAVFSSFSADQTDETRAKAAAAGFGAGMGALQKTCGAVTGGIMVLGSMFFDEKDLPGSKMRIYGKTREFIRRIEKLHGSVECFPILGADIKTEEGLNRAREANLFHLKCEPVVLSVCDVLDEMCK